MEQVEEDPRQLTDPGSHGKNGHLMEVIMWPNLGLNIGLDIDLRPCP